ncbi:glycoside hydrolase family 25 protein [Roseibium sp.]|uniref:glycoside hydrolase family 25 protein n=1 Tax=Roseibium sp. TaxID=1936156 RepID=UPI003B5193FA
MTAMGDKGIDVSHYQGVVNWNKVAADGTAFAMIKASEGESYTDPMFTANWAGCKNNGISCGAYHYFLPTDCFLKQSDLLIKQLQAVSFDPETDLPPAIDCEDMERASASVYVYALKELLETLQRQIKCTPMIYVSPAFWQGLGNPDFTEYPLWIANYTSASEPEIPDPWKGYAIWQFSEGGQVDGITGDVDLDRNNPSVDAQSVQEPKLNWF